MAPIERITYPDVVGCEACPPCQCSRRQSCGWYCCVFSPSSGTRYPRLYTRERKKRKHRQSSQKHLAFATKWFHFEHIKEAYAIQKKQRKCYSPYKSDWEKVNLSKGWYEVSRWKKQVIQVLQEKFVAGNKNPTPLSYWNSAKRLQGSTTHARTCLALTQLKYMYIDDYAMNMHINTQSSCLCSHLLVFAWERPSVPCALARLSEYGGRDCRTSGLLSLPARTTVERVNGSRTRRQTSLCKNSWRSLIKTLAVRNLDYLDEQAAICTPYMGHETGGKYAIHPFFFTSHIAIIIQAPKPLQAGRWPKVSG